MQRHFDRDIEDLKDLLLRMGAMVEDAISQSIRALLERDTALAEEVIANDSRIDQMELEIDRRTLELIAKMQKNAKFTGADDVLTIDGLRVEYPDGFGLARSSNTTPVVVMRFEADSEDALKRIQEDFRRVILAEKADAKLPF